MPKILQRMIECYIVSIAFIFSFQAFWRPSVQTLAEMGLLSIVVLVLSVIIGRLYRYNDVILLLLFLVLAWFSSAVLYGVTSAFFISTFFCFWIILLAVYLVIHIAPDPQHILLLFSFTVAVSSIIICLHVLAYAGNSLFFENPGQNLFLGCFRFGRLFALGNANMQGLFCTAQILVSIYGILHTKKVLRILFWISAILGWFTLGLTGCRTGMIGVCVAVALGACSTFYLHVWQSRHILIRLVCAFAFGAIAGLILLESFMLPVIIYRWILLGINAFARNPYLPKNIAELAARKVSDDDGTLTDRVFIWAQSAKESFRTLRNALFGISSLNKTTVHGIYDGHHEITAVNAHSIYLDTIRRFGLLGFIPWVGLLILWIHRVIQMLFKTGMKLSDRFLAACVAGILVMGISETVPFSELGPAYFSVTFFIICGYCMIETRKTHE